VLEPHVPTEAAVVPDAELLDACEEGRRQARRHEARNAALLAEIDRRQSYGAARLPVDDGVCTDGHPARAWARSGGSSRPLKTGLNAPLSASVRECHQRGDRVIGSQPESAASAFRLVESSVLPCL
jgi:hypothetical protein